MPLSFTPPNGASTVVMRPELIPIMPYCSFSLMRNARPRVAGVDVGGEAEDRFIGHGNRFLLGLEGEDGRQRSEDFFGRKGHVLPGPSQDGRLKERAAQLVPRPAQNHGRPLALGVVEQFLDLGHGIEVDQGALRDPLLAPVADLERRGSFSTNFSTKASWTLA